MNYDLGVESKMLKESARAFFSKEVNSLLIREWAQSEKGYCPTVWKKMAKVGWMGLNIPEDYQGEEASFVDLAVVLDEMGYAGYTGPYFVTAAVGSVLIRDAGSEQQKRDLLPKIAQGKKVVTLAYAGEGEPESGVDLPLSAAPEGDGYRLSGTALFVPYAHVADTIICAARTGEGGEASLFLVDTKTDGVSVAPLQVMADDGQCEVVFDRVQLAADKLLGTFNQGWAVLENVVREAAVAKCAEAVGGARRVLKMTVDYAKRREQFGRPIGSFQAIHHHCADMLTYLDTADLLLYHTCRLISEGMATPKDLAMCKAWVGDACRKQVALGHQVMGGFGFMEEADLQIFYRRSKAVEQLFGDPTFHREIVAQQMGL